jgi:UDP-N-acetylmuramate dehydrogenase
MNIQENISLKPYNTFSIEVKADYLAIFESINSLKLLLNQFATIPKLILGGGSNLLFTQDFAGVVLKNNLKGIAIIEETDAEVIVKVGAGEIWHEFVLYAICQDWGGIENLSLIPGTVGAAPMQNIGAYGVEIRQVLENVEAISRTDQALHIFSNKACKFGYRESIFKHEAKDQFVITAVTFRLTKKNHQFNLSYGDIQKTLEAKNIKQPSLRAVSEAVCQIRRSKLPDPAEIGNAGSFFKNPEIPMSQFELLKAQYPALPSYPINQTTVKIPAGWLIEQAGWKGRRFGAVGVHDRQALVLVNYGGGKGQEIERLAQEIQDSVLTGFGIMLQTEVNAV